MRNRRIGFVFQSFHLLPRATALQNVELPLIYAGLPRAERRTRSRELLDYVLLGDRVDHWPAQLSGGEQQRVALARALANDPDLILADEPTGALDTTTGAIVLDLLARLNTEGRTVVIITHDAAVAARAQRIIETRDGIIVANRENVPRSHIGIAGDKP